MKDLPSDTLTEKKVLGAMMRDKEALIKALDILEYTDFYEPVHGKIFSTLEKMLHKDIAIDFINFDNYLKENGSKPIAQNILLDIIQLVVTTVYIESHAEIIKNLSIRRNFILSLQKNLDLAFKMDQDTDELLESINNHYTIQKSNQSKAERILHDHNFFTNFIHERNNRLLDNSNAIEGVPTGYYELDTILNGFNPGLYILAARPSVGKSALALNFAYNVQKEGHNVLFYSYEMQRWSLAERLVSSVSGKDLKTPIATDQESKSVLSTIYKLGKTNIWINDKNPSLGSLVNETKRFALNENIGLVIIDYLGIMPEKGLTGERYQRIGQITRELKNLSNNFPVIALSQLNRSKDKEPNRKPRLSDLRESGNIEQDADVVMFLHRDPDDTGQIRYTDNIDNNRVELMVSKNRNGRNGRVDLFYDAPCFLFKDQVNAWKSHTDDLVPF